MGNTGGAQRRRHGVHGPPSSHPSAPAPHPPQPEMSSDRFIFAAAAPYPPQNPIQNHNIPHYYPYTGYYPPPPVQLRAPLDRHQRGASFVDAAYPVWTTVQYPCGPVHPPQTPSVEHQKAVTIRNDVNLKKETLRIEPDEFNTGKYVVAFTFDATVSGSITVLFFAKEGAECIMTPTKESLKPVTVSFHKGLGQKFKQPSGTGIDFSYFEDRELTKIGNGGEVYPLAVKAEAYPSNDFTMSNENSPRSFNSQITQAVFVRKDEGEYQPRVVKQILWVNNMRYELQEIYGIGNSVEHDYDGSDSGKECVICLSEPRDTTVLPCRHMCMCSECAKVLGLQTNRCPICRQPVERLLEIKVNNKLPEAMAEGCGGQV